MESLFAVVDIFFVSRLGDEAMAGVALTESVLALIYTRGDGAEHRGDGRGGAPDRRGRSRGGGVAGRGAGDPAGAWRWRSLFGVAGVASSPPDILRLMGADESRGGHRGCRTRSIMLGGNVVILLLFLQNAAFRGAGDAAIAMRVLWIANGLNIVLDPLLIFGLGTVPGAGGAGGGGRDHDRPGHGGAGAGLHAAPPGRKAADPAAAPGHPARAHGPARAALGDGDAADASSRRPAGSG